MVQEQTLILSVMFRFPLSQLSTLGSGGLSGPRWYLFFQSPCHSESDIGHTGKLRKGSQMTIGTNFSRQLYLDPSYRESDKSHYPGREITPGKFSKAA